MYRPPARTTRWLMGAAVAYAAVVLAVVVMRPRLLGHDEAVYAAGARRLWSNDPSLVYPIHRPVGMPVVAAPGVAVGGGDERAMRVPFALIALAGLAVIARVGRRRGGPAAAALAVAVVATTSAWQWRASEVLSDLAAASLLLAMVAVVASDRDGDGAGEGAGAGDGVGGWRRAAGRGLVIGALAAAACYVRYGSIPTVLVVFAIALLDDPRRWRTVAAAAAVTALLLAPLAAWSTARTGSALGVLWEGRRLAGRAYPGAGLVDYLRQWPVHLAGPVTGVVAALGLVAGLTRWRAGWRRAGPVDRWPRLLAGVALGQIAVLGWLAHAETRFVMFALFALVMVGAGWLVERCWRWRAAVVAVALTALPSAVWTVVRVERLDGSRRALGAAAAAIRADAGGRRCLAFSTEAPITAWYSGCRTVQVDGWGLDPADAEGEQRVYLIEARGLPRSIGGVEEATRAAMGWRVIAGGAGQPATVWRAARPAPSW